MKREIKTLIITDDCCPGHDSYPQDTYKNNRSVKARAKGKKKEHKLVRTLHARNLTKQLNDEMFNTDHVEEYEFFNEDPDCLIDEDLVEGRIEAFRKRQLLREKLFKGRELEQRPNEAWYNREYTI